MSAVAAGSVSYGTSRSMSWPPRRPRLPKASIASAAPLTNRTGRSASSNRRCSRNASARHRQILANQRRRLRADLPGDLRRHVRPRPRQSLMNEADHLVAPGHAQEAGPVERPGRRGANGLGPAIGWRPHRTGGGQPEFRRGEGRHHGLIEASVGQKLCAATRGLVHAKSCLGTLFSSSRKRPYPRPRPLRQA